MPLKKYVIYSTMLISMIVVGIYLNRDSQPPNVRGFLSDPFLQLPEKESVRVVWFTDFKGSRHQVVFGPNLKQIAQAKTFKLSRLRAEGAEGINPRSVWRHEAVVAGLPAGKQTPYHVISEAADGEYFQSDTFSLQPLPQPGQALKILLTSDHQQKLMTPANLQKVVETVGRVDAVFFAGDSANIPDNAAEWFDDPSGLGFFAALQGRTRVYNPEHPYQGGQILQYAPIFPVVGHHDVMGRFDGNTADFDRSQPRWYAALRYDERESALESENNPKDRQDWIQDRSFNTITYEEIFSLPQESSGGELYYDLRYGDIYLAGLFITRPLRRSNIDSIFGGKFHENLPHDPQTWLFGEFLFEDFGPGSRQYQWFQQAILHQKCTGAKYRVFMSHQTSRGAGENTLPLLSQPLLSIEHKDPKHGTLIDFFELPPTPEQWRQKIRPLLKKAVKVRYDYPRQRDQWRLAMEPLLAQAGFDLVLQGHSHLWFRMQSKDGPMYLESSNVGNSYGAYLRGYQARKGLPPYDPNFWDPANFAAYDDPYGQPLTRPNLFAPMSYRNRPLPTVDSNLLTVFSILDSEKGTVASYVFDTTRPDDPAVKFDEFEL